MSDILISTHILEQLRVVAKMFSEARIRADERAKAAHERFNVFTTLLRASDEVRLHTRFLHCLLDPQGFHDCGPLFLDLFFATLAELPGVDHKGMTLALDLPSQEEPWTVEKEASRPPYGQIDLLIEQPVFGIAIENKIYAPEQKEQLSRYASYLSGHYGKATWLFYLTLNGEKSSTHGDASYIRISYANHILAWLDKCLRETYRIVPVNQVLVQYREVVRELTGKTIDSNIMNTISDFIAQHPDIIRFRQQINDGIDAARASFLDRLAEGIIKELQDGFHVRLRSHLNQGRFGIDPNGALIITPPESSPLHRAPFEIWVEHIAKWEDALVVGIESKYEKPPLSAEDQLILERMNLILHRDSETRNYAKANAQPTWSGTYWPTGWHNLIFPFDEERLASLLELPLTLAHTVSQLCVEIRSHIQLLENAYNEASSLPPISVTS